jgi:hypothetical protein
MIRERGPDTGLRRARGSCHCRTMAAIDAPCRLESARIGVQRRSETSSKYERSYPLRRVGLVTNARHAGAFAAALFCIVECAAAPVTAKTVTTPAPSAKPLESVEGDVIHSPATSRGAEVRGTARAPGPAGAASSKSSTPAQDQAPLKPASPGNPMNAVPLHETEPAFPALPAASRARTRDCGREWQEMKRSGQAKELTWRDFATRCLTR